MVLRVLLRWIELNFGEKIRLEESARESRNRQSEAGFFSVVLFCVCGDGALNHA